MSSKRQIGRPRVFHLQNHHHATTENDFPAVVMTFWYKYKLTNRQFEKRWADVFQIYPNAIHFNLLQFCPSTSPLGFPVFCWSSSIVLSRYFDTLVNSTTIWSVLKLPKIAWPSPFKSISPELIPISAAWSDWEYLYSPLDRMLVHSRVRYPQIFIGLK